MTTRQAPTPIVTKSKQFTRNPKSGWIDWTLKVRGRGPRGHRLIRVPGRGYVVRRRVEGPGLGLLLLMVGIGAMLADFSLEGFGRVTVVLGAILWCDRRQQQREDRLKETMEPSAETLRFHEDVGYEKGYQARLEEERPKLIDLNARREDVENDQALSSVPGVVDGG